MVIHLADDFNEYRNLCNTKTKTKPTTNKKEVTCKKCIYYLTSEELLSKYNEGAVISSDIKGKSLFN